MDDTTGRLGQDRDREELIGHAEETTRSLDTAGAAAPPSARQRRAPAASRPKATSSHPAVPSAEGLDRDTEKKTRQIQEEIADTREEMAETIDAIQEKLRPANLVADAKEKVRTATTEKVRHMTETASEAAEGAVRYTRDAAYDIANGARQNPIPALMIGAGVAWLLMGRARRQSEQRPRPRPSDWRTEAYPERAHEPSSEYYRSQRVAAGTAVDLEDWRDDARGPKRFANSAREAAGQARNRVRNTTRAAQNGFQRLLRDNPLLVGAAAIVAGAAVGAALPETERENELLGETRDSVVDRAQQAARDAASTVREVTGDAVEQVSSRLTSDKNNT